MRSLSLRLTHKITAIGVIGVIGVILIGGIHMYGEKAISVYREAAGNARTIAELNRKIEVELLEGRRAEKTSCCAMTPGRQTARPRSPGPWPPTSRRCTARSSPSANPSWPARSGR